MREQAVIEAVRRAGDERRRATGVDVSVVRIPARASRRPAAGRIRLRFDRVVLSTARRLREGLAASVPPGGALVVTLSAPIRVAARTAALIVASARPRLVARSRTVLQCRILGNSVRVALLDGGGAARARVACFVHNADSDVALLLRCCRRLLSQAAPPAGARSRRWLALVVPAPGLERVLAEILAELGCDREFRRIFFVDPTGRVTESRAVRRRN
ncbi:MAG: hypothetical protein JSR73_17870 [Proteobacteria bacterium]|nr:hypothetical protein [Pseudomonadota bacterium]